jgi:hypothetical protein
VFFVSSFVFQNRVASCLLGRSKSFPVEFYSDPLSCLRRFLDTKKAMLESETDYQAVIDAFFQFQFLQDISSFSSSSATTSLESKEFYFLLFQIKKQMELAQVTRFLFVFLFSFIIFSFLIFLTKQKMCYRHRNYGRAEIRYNIVIAAIQQFLSKLTNTVFSKEMKKYCNTDSNSMKKEEEQQSFQQSLISYFQSVLPICFTNLGCCKLFRGMISVPSAQKLKSLFTNDLPTQFSPCLLFINDLSAEVCFQYARLFFASKSTSSSTLFSDSLRYCSLLEKQKR